MEANEYVKKFTAKRQRGRKVIAIHATRKDPDGDPLMAVFSPAVFNIAKEIGWKEYKAAPAPKEVKENDASEEPGKKAAKKGRPKAE